MTRSASTIDSGALRRAAARTSKDRPPTWMIVAATAVVIAAALPVVYLFIRGASGGEETLDFLLRRSAVMVVLRTLITVILTTAFSLLVAVPAAWLTMRTDLPLRRLLSVALALPLVVPSFVMATTSIEAFGPRGVLQRMLEPLGVQKLPDIYGLEGATFVLVLMAYPYVYLTVRGAIANMNPELAEACRSMGYGVIGSFRRVTLPLLMPAMGSGAILAALYAISDFGGVALMRHVTLTVANMTYYQSGVDRALGAAMSTVLVVFVVALLLVEASARRGRHRYDDLMLGGGRPHKTAELGWWKLPAFIFVSLPVVAGVIVPIAVLLNWLLRGVSRGQDIVPLGESFLNSLQASGLGALATLIAAVPIALLTVRYRSGISAILERITYIGFGLPGVVVALGLVFFAVNFAFPLYQTIWLLAFAYVVLFLPAAVGSLRSGLLQISPSLEEAAQSLGKKQWQATISVTLPIVMPSIFAGAAMVFLLTMKELPATLILGPTGFDTLATSIWSAASEAYFTRTAAASLILIAAAGIPTAWLVLSDHAPTREMAAGSFRRRISGLLRTFAHETVPIKEGSADSFASRRTSGQ